MSTCTQHATRLVSMLLCQERAWKKISDGYFVINGNWNFAQQSNFSTKEDHKCEICCGAAAWIGL